MEPYKQLADEENLISIDKVRDEIHENDDELAEWIDSNLPETFFKETKSEVIINEYSKQASWAESKSYHYKRGVIDEFLVFDKADAWLIAYCLMTGDTLVTQEIADPNQKNRIKIPDEVNFWRPRDKSNFRVIEEGASFLFKLHAPNDYITGGGFIGALPP